MPNEFGVKQPKIAVDTRALSSNAGAEQGNLTGRTDSRIPKAAKWEYKGAVLLTFNLNCSVRRFVPRQVIAPVMCQAALPLDWLKPNERASIIDMTGDEGQIYRLAEMGVSVGVTLRMVRPGSPCVISIDGKRLSLRLGSDVDVLVAPAGPCSTSRA